MLDIYTSLSYAGHYVDFQRNSQDDSPAKVKYADLNLRASVPACLCGNICICIIVVLQDDSSCRFLLVMPVYFTTQLISS